MKCPDCNFVCSDLRDLCPKCRIDLREHKRQRGLPVTNPRATYQQLLEKLGVPATPSSTNEQPPSARSRFLSSFLGLFQKAEPTVPPTIPTTLETPPAAIDVEVERSPQALSDIASALSVETEQAPVPPTGTSEGQLETEQSMKISATESSPEAVEFQPLVNFDIPEPPSFNEGVPSVASEWRRGPSHESPPLTPPAEAPPEESLQAPSLALATDSAAIESVGVSPDVTPVHPVVNDVIVSEPNDDHSHGRSLSDSETELSSFKSPSLSDGSNQELDALFADALKELFSADSNRDIELSAEHLGSSHNQEQIEILFQLARESITDPESAKRYLSPLETSVGRKIESAEILAQLKKVEQVMNTPMITLKGQQGLGLSGKRLKDQDAQAWSPAPVSITRRLLATVLDGAVIVVLSAILSSSILLFATPDFDELLLGMRPLEHTDLIDLVSLLGLLALLLSVLLPAFTLSLWSTTPGLGALGLSVSSLRGKAIGKAQALVRSTVAPLSVGFFGWTPLLWGRKALHDAVARTVVAETPEEAYSEISSEDLLA